MLGVAFLAKDLLRLHAPDDGREEHLGRPPSPAQLALYRCTGARSPLRKEGEGCGAPLFQRRDVLSRQHRWDAGGGPEHAFYVNALRKGAVLVRNERQEELSQVGWGSVDGGCRNGALPLQHNDRQAPLSSPLITAQLLPAGPYACGGCLLHRLRSTDRLALLC